MSYDFSIAGQYSGRPAYDLYFYIRRDQTDVTNNRSSYAWELRARNPSGSSATFALDCYSWAVNVGGQVTGGCHNLDFRGGQAYIVLGSGTTGWYGHAADGTLNLLVGANHGPAGVFGTAHPADQYFPTDRIPKPPGTPATPTLDSRTTTSVSWNFTGVSDTGGSPITKYTHQIASDSGFSSVIATFDDNNPPATRTGLAGGTPYWVRYRAENAMGVGPWSAALQITTLSGLPAAPVMSAPSSILSTSISTSWSAPDDNGSPLAEYQTERATNSTFTTGVVTVSRSVLNRSYSWTGLTKATRYYFRTRARNGNGWGPWSNVVNATTLATVPSTPPNLTLVSRTTTSITIRRGTPADDGGSAITSYEFQRATNTAFTTGLSTWSSSATDQTASGLTPATSYYFRYRAVNAVGSSAWSATFTADTLPATPPGMTVTPSIDGTSATVTLSPPDGSSSVTSYRVERRVAGTTTPVTTHNTTTSPLVVQPMTPGTVWEWRASAFIGSYQTPWTAWVTRAQPKPNTSPGDYFDGSTPARTDVSFAWLGTVNNSVSETRGVGVEGWLAAGGSAAARPRLQRITGARFGTYAARAIAIADTTVDNGITLGMGDTAPYRAAVAEGGNYVGSMYVRPSRPQRLIAQMFWYDVGGTNLGGVSGTAMLVSSTTSWTRLTATGVAPVGAASVRVQVRDLTGTGFSPWLTGEYLDGDAVMVTIGNREYFDGSTPDDANWDYSWLGTPNASVSKATAQDPAAFDPLADPNCPPPPAPPRPPAIVDPCIAAGDLWRRYWAIIPDEEIPTYLDAVISFTLTTAEFPAEQVRIRVWENPENLPPEEFAGTTPLSEQIISYMPAHTTLTIDGVAQRVTASVDGQGEIPADRLLYGANGLPASWPVLSCGEDYLVSFDVPLDAPDGNLSIGTSLTERTL